MKEIFEVSESPARLSFSKSSPSEFEFSMSIQDQDKSYEQTMLAADELFHDGKLLPLYSMPTGTITKEPVIGRRRSSAGEYGTRIHAHAQDLSRVKVEQPPISPKAPTCTSRWKEFLGLKKVQVQDASNGGKLQKKASCPGNGMAAGRRSVDSLKDTKAGLHYSDMCIHHCSKDIKPTMKEDHRQHNFQELHPVTTHGETHAQYATLGPCSQKSHDGTHHSSPSVHCELPLLCAADPGLCPTTNLQMWHMDRGTSDSRSSKISDESEVVPTKALQLRSTQGGQAVVVKERIRNKSPAKQNEQTRHTSVAISPRRAGRPWGGNRFTESSRSAMTTRLVVKGLDRSYSSPKPLKKRTDQIRYARQRASADGSRTLERSTSYSAGVRVTPVINVPMYITPGLRKGTKNGIFGLSHLFSSKKDKVTNKLGSNFLQPHPES